MQECGVLKQIGQKFEQNLMNMCFTCFCCCCCLSKTDSFRVVETTLLLILKKGFGQIFHIDTAFNVTCSHYTILKKHIMSMIFIYLL